MACVHGPDGGEGATKSGNQNRECEGKDDIGRLVSTQRVKPKIHKMLVGLMH